MFKFLFASKDGDVKQESQREVATRALDELNTILSGLDPKPAMQIDMATGQIGVTWPDQMPDEALALPAPVEGEADTVENIAKQVEGVAEKAV